MSFENLPGVTTNKLDGKLTLQEIAAAPEILILGTAAKGESETYYRITSPTEGVTEFGFEGSLTRGLMEAYGWGGKNFRLWRFGGDVCTLGGVGSVMSGIDSGIVIKTIQKDATAADGVKLAWDQSEAELFVWGASGDLVYHRDFDGSPGADVDGGIVAVTGTYDASGSDIGTIPVTGDPGPDDGVDFDDPPVGLTYLAGSDGVGAAAPSYMKKYELLFAAYKLLENEAMDFVVPMEVYMDVANVVESPTLFSGYTPATPQTYPLPLTQTQYDGLGKLFAQEYLGEWYFWWDLNGDGVAELYPSVGLSSATTDAEGTTLTTADFREVNFAYQLADFCYNQSVSTHECVGMIGVLPPHGLDSASVISWIGKAPTYSYDDDQNLYVAAAADNGTGLLGNKFMAGKSTYRSGAAYGGFVLTADEYPTQSGSIEQIDGNGHLIDIGKYLSIVAGWGVLNTPWDTTGNGYITNMSAAYAGFVSSLGTGSAPTNKLVRKARLPYRVNLTKLDALSRFRYVMIGKRTKGVVWVDAPTAARPDSDYQRQSTVQTVKRVLNDIRIVCDPFIGEANSALQRAALKTQIDSVVGRYVGHGLKGGYCDVSATTNQEISGEATIELVLVPEFELRRITITMSLAATL